MAAQEGGSSYGAGGKFRKKPSHRRQTTPYDRPSTALRPTAANNSSWWSSNIVGPASNMFSKFFASLSYKRLTPPPPPLLPLQTQEMNGDVADGVQGAAVAVPNHQYNTQAPAGGECSQPLNTSSSSKISELEQLLKQKTFTRSEVNQLTELLQSRAVEASNGTDAKRSEASASEFQVQQAARGSMEENRTEGIRSSAFISTPVSNSKVLEDDIASPAELAKAYMGSRPSKVSPSVLGMRSQVGREDPGLLSNIPFASKSPMALTMKTTGSLGAPENGFVTPRSRGRSAIYNMARTPYSKVHPTSLLKGNGNNNSGYPGASVPSSSLSLEEHDEKFGSKAMTLKRRSSVLDDEIGSIGPIRRIRQKSNLLVPRFRQSAHEVGSDAKQKLRVTGESRHEVSKRYENESVPSTSFVPVPSKSSEVAAKILQHLEKMTPKEKSSEAKRSSLKLTPSMLSGQALRSMEDLDSSKLLLDAQDDHKLGDRYNAALPDVRDSTSQKQVTLEENGIKESVVRPVTWNSAMNNDSTVSLKAPGPSTGSSVSAVKNGPSQPPQKKRAFRMSAQEESFEQEDDVHFKELATRPLSKSREPVEAPLMVSRLESRAEPIFQPETQSSCKTSEFGSRDALVGEKSSTTVFQTSEQAVAASKSAVLPISVATFDKSKESNNTPPLFSSSSQVADKFPSLPSEPSSIKSESKLESSSSLVNVSTSTGSQLGIPMLEKEAGLNPQKAGDINGKYDVTSDGQHVSRPLVSFTAASSNDTNQTSSGALLFTSSVPADRGTSTSTFSNSSGSIFGLSSTPSISAGPVFKFGASVDPSPSVSAVSTANVAEIIKPEISPTSGSSPSIVAAFSATTAGSSTFGIGSSFSNSAPNNSQNSLDKSLLSAAGTVSQPTSALSVSSASIPSFNTNSSTSFGSSLSNSQVFNQQSSFGFSSSATTSNANAVIPSNAPTPSVFKFGASSSDGDAIKPSSGSTSGLFSFGLKSSSPSAVGSSSGATTPPLFSFSGSSSAAASTSVTNTASPSPFSIGNSSMFNLGGTSSAPTSAISSNIVTPTFGSTFTSASPSTTGFAFGASSTSSTPTNGASMLFNTPTSSPFSFTAPSASVPNTQPVFGNAQSVFGNSTMSGFGASPGKNDQMNAEDSMAEDQPSVFGNTQPAAPSSAAVFGQPSASPAPAFAFGSTQATSPFMFSGQQNQVNQSPFQASGSLEFNAGGSFSLGSGGGDRAPRRKIQITKSKNRSRK